VSKRLLTESPRILLVINTASKANRDKLAGVFQYVQLHTPWNLQLVDQTCDVRTAANIRAWCPEGMIIGRVPEGIEGVLNLRIPTVIMDARAEYELGYLKKASFITCDSDAIAEVAARFLTGKGFRHFAFLCDRQANNWARDRSRIFKTKLEGMGYACSLFEPWQTPDVKLRQSWSWEQGRLIEWLRTLQDRTVLFVANDLQAREALELCQLAKIRVPGDLAVLSCDNDEMICETTTPTLSSIEPDFEACGYQAAQLLDRLMLSPSARPLHILYGATRIVERESTRSGAPEMDPRLTTGLDFIRLNAARPIGVCDIARHMNVSRRMAEVLFRKHLGHTIGDEIQLARVSKLQRLLSDTNRPITILCDHSGYQSEAHAKRIFKRLTGMTMSAYRQRHKAGKTCFS